MNTVYTVTLNSGFDEELLIGKSRSDGVVPILERHVVPAGKGVNTSRVLAGLGIPTVIYALLGAKDRSAFVRELSTLGIEAVVESVPGETRHNLTLLREAGGRARHFRARGFHLADDTPICNLASALKQVVQPGDVVTLNGSAPEGTSAETWAAFLPKETRARVLIDIQDEALDFMLAKFGPRLYACKPNEEEIRSLPGVLAESGTVRRAIAGVGYMAQCGVTLPLVTLGAAGVVYGGEQGVWRATCRPDRVRRPVGAGDAFMAGVAGALLTGGDDVHALVTAGLTVATAHVEGGMPEELVGRAKQLLRRVHRQMIASV